MCLCCIVSYKYCMHVFVCCGICMKHDDDMTNGDNDQFNRVVVVMVLPNRYMSSHVLHNQANTWCILCVFVQFTCARTWRSQHFSVVLLPIWRCWRDCHNFFFCSFVCYIVSIMFFPIDEKLFCASVMCKIWIVIILINQHIYLLTSKR